MAQRLADDFIKEHISERVQQTQKSLEFIEAQLQRLSNKMQTTEQQLARVKDEKSRPVAGGALFQPSSSRAIRSGRALRAPGTQRSAERLCILDWSRLRSEARRWSPPTTSRAGPVS